MSGRLSLNRDERRLLDQIAKLEAGVKLPIGPLSRIFGATQSVTVAAIEGLVANGHLDRSTLRPPVAGGGQAGQPTPAVGNGRRADDVPAEAVVAEIDAFLARTAMKISQFSRAVLHTQTAYYRLRKTGATVRARTVERIRAFIASHDQQGNAGPVDTPLPAAFPAGGVATAPAVSPAPVLARNMPRAEREALGEAPGPTSLRSKQMLDHQAQARARIERQRDLCETRHAQRQGRIAEIAAREAAERVERRRVAQSTGSVRTVLSLEGIDDEDSGGVTAERREREFRDVGKPSDLIRRATAEWPDKCAAVKALASELELSLAEAWLRVIAAGIDCLTDPESA